MAKKNSTREMIHCGVDSFDGLSDEEIKIKLAAISKARDELTVRYWAVCYDEKLPSGGTCYMTPLTPYFKTMEQARQALGSVRLKYPDAHIGEWATFFSPLRPDDLRDRAALLLQLQ